MAFVPVLHSELIKIRTLRSLVTTLGVMVVVTAAFSALGSLDAGEEGFDPLFAAFFGFNFGQLAAIAFGTVAVSSELRDGSLRGALIAVPDRRRWFAAKAVAIAGPCLVVGLLTGVVSLVVGRAVLGADARGLSWGEGLRGVVGCGVYFTLMALFAAGITALLRSGVATLSILIPFLLIVSFVVGDMSSGVADVLPDRAGQIVFHETWDGSLGPWTGLAVTALWTAAALGAGAWRVRARDA
ncbi:ABC transporter integral membrane protein [Streptomyces lincolnensis]|uniref:ABC transporter integral membrane protein n=1 Tax=Streptomyces lincolnensis TaxID=1915 RepID=A0A1B1M5F3_STRLN|nr:ABC transporter permease [Streptomyces lincolnensis]ANS63677.1 ABC transporter integral membrane protein [Streptomyces lincolnensis]AXG52599.1 ABC transporter integral membrane protein [Streptomyces lincolnensis]QMV05539.1 ABC transporter permease [Streptomyces lincolnensis]